MGSHCEGHRPEAIYVLLPVNLPPVPNAKNEHRVLGDIVPNAIGSNSLAPLADMNFPELLAPVGILF